MGSPVFTLPITQHMDAFVNNGRISRDTENHSQGYTHKEGNVALRARTDARAWTTKQQASKMVKALAIHEPTMYNTSTIGTYVQQPKQPLYRDNSSRYDRCIVRRCRGVLAYDTRHKFTCCFATQRSQCMRTNTHPRRHARENVSLNPEAEQKTMRAQTHGYLPQRNPNAQQTQLEFRNSQRFCSKPFNISMLPVCC